ncbi:MAG: hypothetical protein A2W03_07395 [Candidatus Aminicenantes bacterium RBG_16_63_16]|nr:MAG: hypothetical protein A2W03_07395 [Candidatus Aminicenantes bacterium RBG_16_63_16]
MKSAKNWVWLLLFGSLWGVVEVVVGGFLYARDIPFASVWLTAWAFLMLGAARGVLNEPGSSSAVGAVASLYKLAFAAPYFCHLLGIFFLGMAFDIFATLLLKNKRVQAWKRGLVGVLSAYTGYALFALVITYVARYRPWVAGGWPKVLNHIFVGGGYAALACLAIVPGGYWIGEKGWAALARHPRWALAGALAVTIVVWTLGGLAG